MSVNAIIDHVLRHEVPRSLQIFTPEIVLCVTVVALLLLRMFELHRRLPSSWIAMIGALVAFAGVFAQFVYLQQPESTMYDGLYKIWSLTPLGVGEAGTYFTGLLVHDPFAVFFRLGLTLFLVLVIALTVLSGIPDQEDGQDFYTLLIGSTIGMMMATGSNHLLMLFLSIEMMSVPSYVMVAFQKGRKVASEAAFKYVVFGAGTAGVMLYGLSLISGLLGTALFSEMGVNFTTIMEGQAFAISNPASVTLVLGIMMVLAGIAFKLSLVPFHFWCPDVFEGASAEVGGFLSVASKAAAFALLVRFVMAFEGSSQALVDLSMFFGAALGVISILSMTIGNLAAYTQTNLKRMLAYSTIAHAGYMVMAVAALLIIVNSPELSSKHAASCVEGLTYYLAVYLFMNLAAFSIVALIRNETFSEEIDSYNGLVNGGGATKLLAVCMAIAFFSLVGLPPFGGFFAKMMIFYSAYQAGTVHWFMWVVLAFGGLNTVFSLFYYLRVLRAVFIIEPAENSQPVRTPGLVGAYILLITLPILALGMSSLQGDLTATAQYVAGVLFQ